LPRDRGALRVAEDALGGGGKLLARKEIRIGNAAGEGDDAGIVEQLEQLADRRDLRLAQARREMRDPVERHDGPPSRQFSQYY
jgi:hypothetical protein